LKIASDLRKGANIHCKIQDSVYFSGLFVKPPIGWTQCQGAPIHSLMGRAAWEEANPDT
jgi:hypothetical protein